MFEDKDRVLLDQLSNELLDKVEKVSSIINKRKQVDYWHFMKWFLIATFALTGMASTLILIMQMTGVLKLS